MIETGRLVLRPWHQADRPRFAAIMNTPAMMRHMGGVASPAAMDALLDKRIDDYARHGTCYWAVELRETGELIGSAGLRKAHDYRGTPVEDMLEAGWRVAEAWQGQGFAQEATRAAIDWGWRNRGDDRIGSWTRPDNLPSLRVMRRLGFARRPELDFQRPGSGEACLVHLLDRLAALGRGA